MDTVFDSDTGTWEHGNFEDVIEKNKVIHEYTVKQLPVEIQRCNKVVAEIEEKYEDTTVKQEYRVNTPRKDRNTG